MAEEKIILSIDFPGLSEITSESIKAKAAIEGLLASQKKLEEQGLKNSKTFVDNQQQIKTLSDTVDKNSKVGQANTQATKLNADSIDALKAANKQLLKDRNSISTATEEGRKKISDLNAAYDANAKTIANNSTQVEKQRFNIGNYQSALSGISPELGKFSGSLGTASAASGGLTSGLFGMVKASLAFIATPIGAIIAALVLGFQALKTFLTGTEEGMDILEKTTSQLSAVFGVLKKVVSDVGSALFSFISGDFTKGVDTLSKSFDGLGDRISAAAKEAGDLADIFDALDELQLAQKVRNGEQENQIKNLIIQSKSRNATEQERIDLLKQASDLEKKITGEKIALTVADINASTKQFLIDSDRLDLAQKVGETTIDFTKRIIGNDKLLLAGRTELSDKLGDYNGLLDAQSNIQEKIQNQQDALAQKAEDEAKKRADERKKAADDAQKALDEQAARELKAANDLEILRLQADAVQIKDTETRTAALINIEKVKAKQLLDNDKLTESERLVIAQNESDAIEAIKLQGADKQKQQEAQDLAEALDSFKVYTQGLIDEKKRELLEGAISQQDYNQEIADLNIAALEAEKVVRETFGAEDIALDGRITDAKIANKQKEVDIAVGLEERRQQAIKQGLQNAAALFNKNSIAYKALTIAQIAITTRKAAIESYAALSGITIVGPVLGALAAAAAIAFGLKQAADVSGIGLPKLAKGGLIEGRSHAQGGEVLSVGGKPLAEVERDEHVVVLKKGASKLLRNLSNINEMVGGRSFFNDRTPRGYLADGGFAARSASQQLNTLDTSNLAETLQNLNLFVKVSDINKSQANQKAVKVMSELS